MMLARKKAVKVLREGASQLPALTNAIEATTLIRNSAIQRPPIRLRGKESATSEAIKLDTTWVTSMATMAIGKTQSHLTNVVICAFVFTRPFFASTSKGGSLGACMSEVPSSERLDGITPVAGC
jgi:hypothetical protein